ncbi:ABC transporter ATP-binding protein [Peribacillus cavernae]|uniref:ABC transporter ATP-binding protein n=1 Tax=Peribacillus cavernae TaxID=1674310 RepID=A0A3S0UG71_9BACI|nr:ABC transporter ATP-binding protein [Peribacillus cavernae]MDQ0218677.1 branched-chain amino acid transport system ATP-binding protein [Peribacillus cavernae]RUQ30898.1 ABC transporter ATP-binding protein [Peribacillus cavernae]
MLKVNNLHTYHGFLHVLKGIDLEVLEGELVAIVGSNGSGKSTLLGTLAGVYLPKEGSIIYKDEEITNDGVQMIVPKGICLVPERRQIFSSITVKDNLLLGAYHRYQKDKKTINKDYEDVVEMFPRLKQMLDRPGGLLSGGEQQMLAIGRGLMAKPKVLMLDEPSLGLAPLIVKDIMMILRKLCDEMGTTIILVEQNLKAALKVADRGCVLAHGKIVVSGTSQELLHNPKVQEAYFGKSSKKTEVPFNTGKKEVRGKKLI